ncbi:MAG TPA: type II toxin-antitoxin system HipA family toxin [Candidatus Marinimicrobia bacterium]|nr:type II toxin-antitoxin system HipA family toxin [Candidatus Neomarinimicrobiota bacterium]
MGRKKKSAALDVMMNGEIVGKLLRQSSGMLEFIYDDSWLSSEKSRSISLSMPSVAKRHSGTVVENFFDNLLPDNLEIKKRIQARFAIPGNSSFDLLSEIGRDCIGALQLVPEGHKIDDIRNITAEPLTETQIASILKSYKTAPLGMDQAHDFRISLAGAQEKTALLKLNNQWCRPLGTTPTTHIIKLPIGIIKSAGLDLDLSDSVENEWLCHLLLQEFKIPVAACEIRNFGGVKALVVERFDRQLSQDGSWIIRLPQEDMCQALAVSPGIKYENQGGPGISDIMKLLQGSIDPGKDRYLFMKVVFLYWLLGAIDGHGKNFSLFLRPGNNYELSPVYDVISVYPLVATGQLDKRNIAMAMAVKGKAKHYHWENIQLRHWRNTANAEGFSDTLMREIVKGVLLSAETAVSNVMKKIPADFPPNIYQPTLKMFSEKCQAVLKYQWKSFI